MNLTTWGVLCVCEYPDNGDGDDYSENIYGEYDTAQEAEAAMEKAYQEAARLRENDPTDSRNFSFNVLDPQELYDWITAG